MFSAKENIAVYLAIANFCFCIDRECPLPLGPLFRMTHASFCCHNVHLPHESAPSNVNLIRRRTVCRRLDSFYLHERLAYPGRRGQHTVFRRRGHLHACVRRTLNFAQHPLQVSRRGGLISELTPHRPAEDSQRPAIDIYADQPPAVRSNFAIRLQGKKSAANRQERFTAKAIHSPQVDPERKAKHRCRTIAQRFEF